MLAFFALCLAKWLPLVKDGLWTMDHFCPTLTVPFHSNTSIPEVVAQFMASNTLQNQRSTERQWNSTQSQTSFPNYRPTQDGIIFSPSQHAQPCVGLPPSHPPSFLSCISSFRHPPQPVSRTDPIFLPCMSACCIWSATTRVIWTDITPVKKGWWCQR